MSVPCVLFPAVFCTPRIVPGASGVLGKYFVNSLTCLCVLSSLYFSLSLHSLFEYPFLSLFFSLEESLKEKGDW